MVCKLSKCKTILTLYFLTISLISYAQIEISGIVTDSNKSPLSYANVTIHDLTTQKIVSYAITDEKGAYELSVKQGKYKFKISYLGYKPFSQEKTINKNEVLNFTLVEDTTSLDEVVIKAKSLDATIKNDTTKYNLKKFTTGNEQNLKEVLGKLPGIEIEKGKIKANGKKIDKLLINGKELFGDQHQLTTENISSEMVESVSLLNNFKDFSDLSSDRNEKTALNIEIQKKYRGKIKGNISVAGGNNSSYQANSNLFLFNTKTNLSFVGGINNIGEQIFTFEDYINFQGGIKKLVGNNNVSTISEDKIPSYLLPNSNFKTKKDLFSALNFTYKPSEKFKLNSYVIFDKINSVEQELITQKPLSNFANLSLNINRDKDNSFLVNNTFLDAIYKISDSSLIAYSLNYSPQTKSIQILENFNTRNYNSQNQIDEYSLSQVLNYKKVYKKSVLSFSLFSNFNNTKENLDLSSNREFLNLIFKNKGFLVHQTLKKENTDYGFIGELNQKIAQNISFKFLYKLQQSSHFLTSDTEDNFNNDISVNSNENNVDFSVFSTQRNLINYKIGISYKNLKINNISNNYYLPFANLKFVFKKTHSLSFGYRKSLNLPNSTQLIKSPLIVNFNTLKANQNVNYNTASLYDNYSLQYFIYDLFSGTLLTFGGNLNIGKNTITTNTKIANTFRIDNFYTGVDDKQANAYFLLDKKFSKIKFKLRFKNSFLFNQRNSFINDKPRSIKNKVFSNSLIVSSNFSSKFNFDLGYNRNQNDIQSTGLESKIISNTPFASLYFDFEKFNFQLKKSVVFYNSDIPNQYLLDVKFDYFMNKKWNFFLKGKNILNVNKNYIAQNKVYSSYIEDKIISTMQGFVVLGMKYNI